MNDPKPLNVLFIGNSHTYYNFMPQLLVGLVKAANQGLSVEVEQSTGKGVSLEWHWNNSETRERICAKNWDYIVLQEHPVIGIIRDCGSPSTILPDIINQYLQVVYALGDI